MWVAHTVRHSGCSAWMRCAPDGQTAVHGRCLQKWLRSTAAAIKLHSFACQPACNRLSAYCSTQFEETLRIFRRTLSKLRVQNITPNSGKMERLPSKLTPLDWLLKWSREGHRATWQHNAGTPGAGPGCIATRHWTKIHPSLKKLFCDIKCAKLLLDWS